MNAPDDSKAAVDETDDAAKLYVADPDDYAKTRKLKALNDAKAQIREVRKDRPPKARPDEWEGLNRTLSRTVASYGHELLPLLEEAEQAGTIIDDDYYARGDTDIRTYIITDGRVEADDGTHETAPPSVCMAVYRHLERLERKIGLGPSLEEDTDDDWKIET